MATMNPELKSKLEQNPNAVVNLIVRTTDDPTAHLAEVQARGLQVRHTYSLISAMAVQGKASVSMSLINMPWVLSLEEDKTVHTMS
jgi:hypothetical protein